MVHLHLHTKYSLLDAIIKIDELMDKLVEMGQTACAITDHGNMYGSVEFYKSAKEHGIKPIIGCEVYICDDVTIMKRENKMYHLILLAKNETGRLNLQKLVTESTKYKFNKRPRIDFSMLERYHEGLICCSACMVGEVSFALLNNNVEKAYEIAIKYKNLFGEDYYIEYQAHKHPKQQELNRQLVQVALDLGIKYVVTCDSHYLNKEDQKYHDIFVQIGQARETGETYDDCYVQSEEEVIQNAQSTSEFNEQAIINTHEIADKCNVDYPLSAPIIPHTNIPETFSSEADYLQYLCDKGWKDKGFAEWSLEQWKTYMSEDIYDEDGNFVETRRFIDFNTLDEIIKIYQDRIKYEMNSVVKMGFEGYYLLVRSYISSAYRRGIARGSAGGSLLAYLCGIVDIDPIKYGLYFERFIDVGALDLLDAGIISKKELKIPDVDADFSTTNREKVMNYIVNTYGEENVVCLGTFQYLRAKSAIKDIGKVLGIPFEVTNEMTKEFDDESIDEVLELGLLEKYEKQYPELFVYASKLSNLPKSSGKHACGKVITMQEATYYNALEYDSKEDTYNLQGDMHTADDLGLVKIDLLGLRTLDVIYDVLEMTGHDYDFIAPHKIDLCDKSVWKEFINGNSLQIFQFESPGMRRMLKDMKCNSIEDLSAANALYRPGSKDYIPNYIARKNGTEKITYINDMLQSILKNTYGIIVYQEQLIEIGRMAGLRNPDELRQATAKKKIKLMNKIEPEMKSGLINKGWTEDQVNTLWDDILKFAKYSFNKSHSQAYGLIAYITMFLKVHYPTEFITASINSYNGDANKISEVVLEGKRMGVKCVFDDWRVIPPYTECKDGIVHLGINTVSGFGINTYNLFQVIANENPKNFIDLLLCSSSSDIEKAIKLGWFEEYGEENELLFLYELFIKYKNTKGELKTKIKASKSSFEHEHIMRYTKEFKPEVVKEVNIDAIRKTIPPDRIEKFDEIVQQSTKHKKDGTPNGINYEKFFKLTEMPENIKRRFATKISEAEYVNVDMYKLLSDIKYKGPKRSIKQQIKDQQDFLSYIDYIDPNIGGDPEKASRYVVVTNLNSTYSPVFKAYCIKNGQMCDIKVHKTRNPKDKNVITSFANKPFEDGDVLYMKKTTKKPRYRKEGVKPDGSPDFKPIPGEYIWWLDDYDVVGDM